MLKLTSTSCSVPVGSSGLAGDHADTLYPSSASRVTNDASRARAEDHRLPQTRHEECGQLRATESCGLHIPRCFPLPFAAHPPYDTASRREGWPGESPVLAQCTVSEKCEGNPDNRHPSRTCTIRMCLSDGRSGTITGALSGKVKRARLEGSLRKVKVAQCA